MPPFRAPLERSVSTSRQFLVYGTDVRLRGAICDLAERTKRDLLQLIDQRDEWITPIVVNAQYPQANLPETPRAALNLAQTGFGLKLQLDLTIDLDVSQPEVRRELLRAILLEMMYRQRNQPARGHSLCPATRLAPRWNSAAAIRFRPGKVDRCSWERRWPRAKFLRLKNSCDPETSSLDAPSRSLFCAYSFALVELLTHTPDGRERLARFIADLPCASNDPMADLGLHFPELGNARPRGEGMELTDCTACGRSVFSITQCWKKRNRSWMRSLGPENFRRRSGKKVPPGRIPAVHSKCFFKVDSRPLQPGFEHLRDPRKSDLSAHRFTNMRELERCWRVAKRTESRSDWLA